MIHANSSEPLLCVPGYADGHTCNACAGGTRFIGVYLARQLVEHGHSVTLLTRGKKEIASQIPDDTDESFAHYKSAIKHIASDRKDKAQLEERLAGKHFDGETAHLFPLPATCADNCSRMWWPVHQHHNMHMASLRYRTDGWVTRAVLYDLNGREADEAELILGALGGNVDQYIFCSSAGVYLKSHMMPHHESDAGDPKSRHKARLFPSHAVQGPAGASLPAAVGRRWSSLSACMLCRASLTPRHIWRSRTSTGPPSGLSTSMVGASCCRCFDVESIFT